MNNNIVELLDKVGAYIARHSGRLLAIAILAVALVLLLRWMGRLYKRYQDAGQERLGLYVVGSMQSWLFLFLFTLSVWLPLGLGKISLAQVQSRLWLNLPEPNVMVLWSAGLALALAAIAFAITEIEDALKIPPTRHRILMQPRTIGETAVWSLIVSPTAGFCEEVLFRGVLFFALMDMTHDVWLSVALASTLFGIVHAPQGLVAVLGTAAIGAVLALGFVFTGSLWPSIIAHTLYDMAVPFLSRLDEFSEA